MPRRRPTRRAVAARRGRPLKLTEELQQRILVAVRAGVGIDEAFRLAGVSSSAGYEWLCRGRGQDTRRKTAPQVAQFAQALEKAQAEDEAARIARINAAGRGGAVIYTRTLSTKVEVVARLLPSWLTNKPLPHPHDYAKFAEEGALLGALLTELIRFATGGPR